MPQVVAIDSRLPPSTTTDPEDPTNPAKAIKDLKKLENQTTADTKYDIQANLREGFAMNNQSKNLAVLGAIIVGFLILIFPQPLAVRIVLGVSVIYGLHYILGQLEKKTV